MGRGFLDCRGFEWCFCGVGGAELGGVYLEELGKDWDYDKVPRRVLKDDAREWGCLDLEVLVGSLEELEYVLCIWISRNLGSMAVFLSFRNGKMIRYERVRIFGIVDIAK
jgi:hypothetical protein